MYNFTTALHMNNNVRKERRLRCECRKKTKRKGCCQCQTINDLSLEMRLGQIKSFLGLIKSWIPFKKINKTSFQPCDDEDWSDRRMSEESVLVENIVSQSSESHKIFNIYYT